jgi:hypothetical protein
MCGRDGQALTMRNQVGCPSSDHAAGDPTSPRRLPGTLDQKSAPTLDRAIGVAPPDAPVLMAVFVVAGGLGMGLTVALLLAVLVRLLDRVRPVVDVAHLG